MGIKEVLLHLFINVSKMSTLLTDKSASGGGFKNENMLITQTNY